MPTLADQIRRQHGRVVTLSMKARSAIGLAGHGGDVVLWFDTRGGWATSTAFTPQADAASSSSIRARIRSCRRTAMPWERLYDASAYQGEDDNPVERAPTGWTRTFPHVLGIEVGQAGCGILRALDAFAVLG